MNHPTIVPTLFDFKLSDNILPQETISLSTATNLFEHFRSEPLFNWVDSHNGCEARAEALCLLLDAWLIPNCKGWVFGGQFLKKHFGGLKKNWKYHVAALLPVLEENELQWYAIDPATSARPQTLQEWAANVTGYAHSYHMIKESKWYIFSDKKIKADNWNARNRQNRKWMIQGLAGVNGLSTRGKSQLTFNKGRIKNRLIAFEKLKKSRPAFLATQ